MNLGVFLSGYLVLVWLGHLSLCPSTGGPGFWPATGWLLGFLLERPYRDWPVAVASAAVAHWFVDSLIAHGTSSELLVGTVAGVLAALILKRFPSKQNELKAGLGLVVLGAGLASGFTALLGTVGETSSWTAWRTDWLAHGLGVVVVTPLTSRLAEPRKETRPTLDLVFWTSVAGLSWMIFSHPAGLNLPYLMVPLFLWAALHVSLPSLSIGMLLASQLVVILYNQGESPFSTLTPTAGDQLLLMQSYLGLLTAGTLVLWSAVTARQHSVEKLYLERARLVEAEAFYQKLFQQSAVAVVVMSETIEQCNERASRLLGPGLIGKTMLQLCPDHQPDGRLSDEVLADALEAAKVAPVRLEWTALTQDARTLPLELWLSKFDFEDDPRFLLVARDRTLEQSLMQELQRENRRLDLEIRDQTKQLAETRTQLEQQVQSKDRFLAAMSHRLRTPLTAIQGLVENLLDGVYQPLTEPQLQPARRLGDKTHHLLELVEDILNLARVRSGELEARLGGVDVEQAVRAAILSVTELAHQKGLIIEYEQEQPPLSVAADEGFLREILVNLLDNAVKFTPRDRRVGVRVRRMGETVKVTVWDEGEGIPAHDLERIFQPFYRASARRVGSGLGLALVQRMVELQGGSLKVDSEVGRGSQFCLSFRQAPEPTLTEETDQTEVDHPPPRQARLLVAEDSEVVLTAVTRFLTKKGFEVFQARDGQEAVEKVSTARPHLVLMDIQMPEMDGLEAIERIRLQGYTAPVIAWTALTMPGDQERCLEAGADLYLPKPIPFQRLLQEISSRL